MRLLWLPFNDIYKKCVLWAKTRADYKYSVISITNITSFFHFLLLSTSNVRMSESTFCRVEVHILYTIYCLSKNIQKVKDFLMNLSFFPSKRNVCILHGQVFVMMVSKVDTANHNQKSHVVISHNECTCTHNIRLS